MADNKSHILRLPEVIQRTTLGRTSIYDLIKKGQFPRQIKLSLRRSGWVATEIDEWIENLRNTRHLID